MQQQKDYSQKMTINEKAALEKGLVEDIRFSPGKYQKRQAPQSFCAVSVIMITTQPLKVKTRGLNEKRTEHQMGVSFLGFWECALLFIGP